MMWQAPLKSSYTKGGRRKMDEEALQEEVWNIKKLAKDEGLDFYPIEFEMITRKTMVEFGTYVLPKRYSHWTFGKHYGKLRKLQNLGAIEILEMVLNSDPAKAYLLDSNTDVEIKMVIAHVYGHVDFFKNNYWFSKTNKNIINEAEFHEKRIHELEYEFGKEEVEKFLDTCISLQWHTDYLGQFSKAGSDKLKLKKTKKLDLQDLKENVIGDDPTIITEFTTYPDLLQFIIDYAPLKKWQTEILAMIRGEMLYFMPIAITKIMNEGWATLWQEIIMQKYLDFSDYDKFAIKHSEVIASPGLNPYRLGYMIYKDLIRKWDKKEGNGAGMKKIFEIRKIYNDISFLEEFLTQEVVNECGLFVYDKPIGNIPGKIKSTQCQDIKIKLLGELVNFGKPKIVVKICPNGQSETLQLFHDFDGRELIIDQAKDVLKSIYTLWKNPIQLETVNKDGPMMLVYDGDEMEIVKLDKKENGQPKGQA